jgi:thiosulfate/3-mercaptopyruvate sulfurtransferase
MDVFVGADWLASRLDDPGVRVVDVRDEWEYEGIGHLPGAASVPFDRFRSAAEDASGMLPAPGEWRDLLSAAGVTPDDHLVAYDDTHGVFAARFLVTAYLYGHPLERLHLLDGDYSAWARERPTTTEVPDVDATAYEAAPLPAAESPLVDYETVLATVEAGDALILDTREPAEYAASHLPGAVQLNWRDLVDEETRGLLARERVESVLAERGVSRDRRVVLYCNTARRISHTYLVLRGLGHEDVAFYEGSLTEWEARGGPVEGESAEDGADDESESPAASDDGQST